MKKHFRFHNLSHKSMSFTDVYHYIKTFIKQDPKAQYRLMIGTDSQVHAKSTRFITGIVIRREGHGVWACLTRRDLPRRIENLHEKISIETTITEEVAQLFTPEKKRKLLDITLPHIDEGSSFTIEGHLDVGRGKQNKTKVYVKEMMARLEELGMKALVKPDSFVASSYANRYTK
ncbi:ribonuclease H-like YkuK family protein [Desertibacillus haloalkaliphilus]|uniref:ribonuclease H-like YkuK family protein n=1 Tax=Desertibacillus haloalkaliphilus TaxID=1328930 RepID=UPI001C267554|nr:ribonuclease H-like YkuK family protein [Desertibacillus haloalkaliphilus]MBU8906484.1 ribonuclease H-like YkuK family protein [Desertibacillus haloalkaliphilus]